jgi:hypothetical protein
MVLSLLFGKKYAKTSVSNVVLDAILTEDHSYNSRVTNYPVENGLIISDHIINEPETLQITGVVSDTPLSFLAPFNNSINAFNTLIEIHNRRERITVVTGIKVYTDMVITSLQVPRNVQSGQSLTFVIDLQKIFLDNSVRLTLNTNNPFNRVPDVIPREQVADANKYPFIQADPPTSLKDQASSGVDAGIQDLLPVPAIILPRIRAQAAIIGTL